MAKSLNVTERGKEVVNGEKNVTATDATLDLKDLHTIRAGQTSFMGGKAPQGIATTVATMNDGSRRILFARVDDVFQAIKKVATSGKNQTVASSVPADAPSDADVVEAFLTSL